MKANTFCAILSGGLILLSCESMRPNRSQESAYQEVKVETTRSVEAPKNGALPIAGISAAENPSKTVIFSKIGEKIEVKTGETVNIIYDGINPEETYILYESTVDGYNLQLAKKNESATILFSRLCQTFIVLNPDRTLISVPENLRYEQIIWTPRADGTWEVRLGSQERGCESPALDKLQKLRTKEYNKQVPR